MDCDEKSEVNVNSWRRLMGLGVAGGLSQAELLLK
jgi:hypothetical protein